MDCSQDYRSLLTSTVALEVLRAMYALDDTSANPLALRPSKETMTKIRVTLCKLVWLLSTNERVCQIKMAATNGHRW